MPRKKKTLEELEAQPLDRKPRRKKSAVALSEPLAEIAEQYDLKPASELPARLEPATMAEIDAARKARETIDDRHPEQEPPPERPLPPMNGKLPDPPFDGPQSNWQDKVRRLAFVVPQGFMNVDSYPVAGIKVNKSLDRTVAAIQFRNDQIPSRAEKDLMETQGISYDPSQKQWIRYDRENHGENILDAKRIAYEIAEDRMRMLAVMGDTTPEGRGR